MTDRQFQSLVDFVAKMAITTDIPKSEIWRWIMNGKGHLKVRVKTKNRQWKWKE